MIYKRINNIIGWIIFIIASATYILTVEPTASLWDCSEFILTAFKLEVGHPPGAPLFMMVAHLFTMFASPENVAYMVNIFSALCSGFTILFLFWSITHIARRFIQQNGQSLSLSQMMVIMGSGIVGALAYTFSDTFWFSAVEGEVYAASSLLSAIVFWAILRWEEEADARYANRWLVLIFYITGLSIGVHLLNLLVVPTIVFVYYFKKYPVTRKGVIITSLIAVVLLAALVFVIIPLTPVFASWFELLFVNVFGLPINSGLLFFVVLLIVALSYGVYYTRIRGKALANTIMLCLSLCMLGYGTYAMIVIRSSANLPMDQNKPDNIFALKKYLDRDQYGSRPLLTGAYYTDVNDYTTTTRHKYIRLGDKYVKKDFTQEVNYRRTTLFPRMWSANKPDHVQVYKTYTKGKRPTFGENLAFFFDYQISFMYWRYFMWNFVGRQNDMQGDKGDLTKGNWISGIKFIDEARLGPQDSQPDYLANNKGTNKYYFLPLLLGILGIIVQYRRDKKGFTLVTLLFFFTGVAIIMYLNQTPNEPRERDYAYAGSFYAFAVWIGLGVAWIASALDKILKNKQLTAAIAFLVAIPAPIIMAQQNWDDHDRSGRYIATDFGYNFLTSCDPNGVLYTYGDNDSFPLWYNQEVENVGTSLKVANTMYLASDWYYMQMMRRSYDAAPLATTAMPAQIIGETRAIVPYSEQRREADMKAALNFVMSDDKKTLNPAYPEGLRSYFPTRTLILPIDTKNAVAQGLAKDSSTVLPYLRFTVGKENNEGKMYITKNKLAILDIAANNFGKRPIYYGTSGDDDLNMGIDQNLRIEGLVKKLVAENTAYSPINIDKTFDLLVNQYRYRGLNDSSVYLDETARRMVSHYRVVFFFLAQTLQYHNDTVKLRQLMEKYHEAIPTAASGVVNIQQTPYERLANPVVDFYFAAGLTDYGNELAAKLLSEYSKEFTYYSRLASKTDVNYEMNYIYRGISSLTGILRNRLPDSDLLKQCETLTGTLSSIMRKQ